jgi:hypothetical protein
MPHSVDHLIQEAVLARAQVAATRLLLRPQL